MQVDSRARVKLSTLSEKNTKSGQESNPTQRSDILTRKGSLALLVSDHWHIKKQQMQLIYAGD